MGDRQGAARLEDEMREVDMTIITFPSISTGVYSYPVQQAAEIAIGAVREVVKEYPKAFDEILWVLFDERTKLVYDGALQKRR